MTIYNLEEETRLAYAVQIAAGLAAAQYRGSHSVEEIAVYSLKLVDALLQEANR